MKKKSIKRPIQKSLRKKPQKRLYAFRRTLRFLPALLLFAAAFSLQSPGARKAVVGPDGRVLSYATNVNVNELLTATNAQRTNSKVNALQMNPELVSAAQTKANDMVARGYWSHNTPDGKEPWTFILAAGYQYSTAGENLAYGFSDSNKTITGWMNSPTHRENLMNDKFTEVGFGIANSADYVGKGEETIVVAMYGAPSSSAIGLAESSTPEAQNTNIAGATTSSSEPTSINRIQLLTNGNATWSTTALVLLMSILGAAWVLGRGLHIRRLIRNGESFIKHHVHLDLTVLGFIAVGWAFLQTSGVIR
jgi:uncharacterized protein YkwD